jgi:hypothetical protein
MKRDTHLLYHAFVLVANRTAAAWLIHTLFLKPGNPKDHVATRIELRLGMRANIDHCTQMQAFINTVTDYKVGQAKCNSE